MSFARTSSTQFNYQIAFLSAFAESLQSYRAHIAKSSKSAKNIGDFLARLARSDLTPFLVWPNPVQTASQPALPDHACRKGAMLLRTLDSRRTRMIVTTITRRNLISPSKNNSQFPTRPHPLPSMTTPTWAV